VRKREPVAVDPPSENPPGARRGEGVELLRRQTKTGGALRVF